MAHWFLLYIIVGISVTNTIGHQTDDCCEEDGPTQIRVKGIRFDLHQQLENWYKANELCRATGMRLATMTNQQKNNRLKEFLSTYGGPENVWLSGSDLAQKGSFTWMSTGQPLLFTDWKKNAKSNWNPRCLQMYKKKDELTEGYGWIKNDCEKKEFFVCESY